jgi:hypothetical protein
MSADASDVSSNIIHLMKAIFDSGATSMQSLPVRTTGYSDVSFHSHTVLYAIRMLAAVPISGYQMAPKRAILIPIPPTLSPRHVVQYVLRPPQCTKWHFGVEGGRKEGASERAMVGTRSMSNNHVHTTSCILVCLFIALAMLSSRYQYSDIVLTLLWLALVAVDDLPFCQHIYAILTTSLAFPRTAILVSLSDILEAWP